MLDITISVVLYHTDEYEVRKVLHLINRSGLSKAIYLIDNSSTDNLRVLSDIPNVTYLFNDSNLGYGSGHNVAIKRVEKRSKYHLVINSDVDFDPAILQQAFDFMESNSAIGMLSPKILDPDGNILHFCRKLPDPFDLFLRRFIPNLLKPLVKSKLDNYLLVDKDYSQAMNIPNLPGCFMFIRTAVLNLVGGFDERYFMYVEDVDLTRRIHERAVTLYYPKIEIVHYLAQGSYKFTKLVRYHIFSAISYFNKWGWFLDKDRVHINRSTGVYFLLPSLNKKELSEVTFMKMQLKKSYNSK